MTKNSFRVNYLGALFLNFYVEEQMKLVRFLSLLLMVVGALNWGLWGFFQYNLIQDLFAASMPSLVRVIYCFVGLAGLCGLSFFFIPCIYKGGCSCQK